MSKIQINRTLSEKEMKKSMAVHLRVYRGSILSLNIKESFALTPLLSHFI